MDKMTAEEAKKLKSGTQLTWRKRPQSETPQDKLYFAQTGVRLPRTIGQYPDEMFAKSFGEAVEFVSFVIDPLTEGIKLDISGFPVILVKTTQGERSFSSFYFE